MSFSIEQPSYKALRSIVSERTRPIIAWVGSGLSCEANLPTWPKLKEDLISTGRLKAQSLDNESGKKLLVHLDSIENEENYWIAFERLRDKLGNTTYRDTIRGSLLVSEDTELPNSFLKLWQMGIRGILNLNIDRLASRALSQIHAGRQLTEFQSKHIGDHSYILGSSQKFIANLHGVVENAESWIFCKNDLRNLLIKPEYTAFIQKCLTTHTVIFVGISADDIAVGGHLQHLKESSIEMPSHYWISSRCDNETDDWAEELGVRMIRYSSEKGNHSELQEFFDDILGYVPTDREAPPVFQININDDIQESFPNPNELSKLDPEEIRHKLNTQAAKMLSSNPPNYEEYEEFCLEYDYSIYASWYTTMYPPNNSIFGIELLNEEKSGAFGKVYKAINSEGYPLAVKILHEGIRRSPELLKAFRRGVRSMRILEDHNATGMAKYVAAYEIPTCVVMDWIDGPNLTDAVLAGAFSEWNDIITLFTKLAAYLHQAHSLPERVLHRDLRPSNIMIENMYSDPDNQNVILTDFDLSWHKGATEDSIVHGSTMAGYLAPEQLRSIEGVSTRHSSVDSFGLGMTMFFVLSSKDPFPAQHRHQQWSDEVSNLCARKNCSEWISLPARFTRLILSSTEDHQASRMDMSQVLSELRRMSQCLSLPLNVEFAELVAEEIAARCQHDYIWDEDQYAALIEYANGITARIIGNESERRIEFVLEWRNTGNVVHRRVKKYITKLQGRMLPILRKSGWEEVQLTARKGTFYIEASVSSKHAMEYLNRLAEGIGKSCSLVIHV